MSKKTPIKKKDTKTPLSEAKGLFAPREKYKDQEWYDLGKTFQEIVGLPGFAKGHTNVCLGHSDTGKTSAVIAAAVDAQKKGDLPVFIITEQKWSFEHAQMMGFQCEQVVDEETGELYWDGDFIIKLGFDFIEQAFEYVTSILDYQAKGKLPYDLLFIWDSIGTIPCEASFNGKGGNMHTARVISEKFGQGLAQRITASRKQSSAQTNTMVFINQPWVELPDNPMGKPKIKPKGGESIYLAASLVFLFGNEKSSGVSKVDVAALGRKVKFATRTKISVHKNHINGLGYTDGKIVVTPYGYEHDTPDMVKKFKENHLDYFKKVFNGFDFKESDIEFEETEVVNEEIETSDTL